MRREAFEEPFGMIILVDLLLNLLTSMRLKYTTDNVLSTGSRSTSPKVCNCSMYTFFQPSQFFNTLAAAKSSVSLGRIMPPIRLQRALFRLKAPPDDQEFHFDAVKSKYDAVYSHQHPVFAGIL